MMKQLSKRIVTISTVLAVAGFCAAAEAVDKPLPDHIEFNRDIRPIFAENCYSCHGPDSAQRKADLRLDTKDGLLMAVKNKFPIVADHPEQSEIYRRITADKPDDRMPDPGSNKHLTQRQIALVKQWIEQGAVWQPHWAFIAPVRPEVPGDVSKWARNPIDRFIEARLGVENLAPAPEADKTTLIRRVTFDLTGLPPTPQEVDAFLADASPDAYERVVDRLLANPHYGERMALDWLDASRYADTHGYHIDSGRDMTRWRDWVINSFNNNKPFDQFTVEQVGGDLLPNATVDQKIASGFNRNSMINFEGGAIPEEYLTAYLIDRVATTSTVFLGLTMNCCQCHDHKFDPIKQKEFYEFYAFFNGIKENGLDGQAGNAAPVLKLPTSDQKSELSKLVAQITPLEKKLAAPDEQADASQVAWEKSLSDPSLGQWTSVTPSQMRAESGATLATQPDGSVFVDGPPAATDVYTIELPASSEKIASVRLEVLPDERLQANGSGRSENGNFVLSAVRLNVADKRLSLSAATADFSQDRFAASSLTRSNSRAGWAIFPEVAKPHSLMLGFKEPTNDKLTLTLEFKSGFANHEIGRFRVYVSSQPLPERKAMPAPITKILAMASEHRSPEEAIELRTWYRGQFIDEFKPASKELMSLRKQQERVEAAVPSTMVMEEMAKPRDTFILLRGQYDKFGEKVTANTPAALPPMAPNAPHNRLGLAEWIVDRGNPLTARVTVNRIWQTFFGAGIVRTPGDFGTQGDVPSHPELLDWLAVQFRDGDTDTHAWDVKALVRLIVTSSTYRQSSHVTPAMLVADPEDRLLERGPRFRLHAEFIRDEALADSGLLDTRIGGESVYPYQPAGLWEELMSRNDGAKWTAQTYTQSHGPDLYRRSMYTFWKRTSPPPTLSAFDAPDREVCAVKRTRTNTPLQALVMWNDPTYMEAARKMAERVMTADQPSVESRIVDAFRIAAGRKPTEKEAAVLKKVFDAQLDGYRNNPGAVEKLLSIGEAPRNMELDQTRLAAWTMVCSTILNLDETITRS
jgi:hypothetical protein